MKRIIKILLVAIFLYTIYSVLLRPMLFTEQIAVNEFLSVCHSAGDDPGIYDGPKFVGQNIYEWHIRNNIPHSIQSPRTIGIWVFWDGGVSVYYESSRE